MQIVRQNQKDGDTTNSVELWDVLLHGHLWKQTLEELPCSVIHLWLYPNLPEWVKHAHHRDSE